MTLPVVLSGKCTTTNAQNEAAITSRGALVTASYDYDLTEFNLLGTDDAGVNFYKPIVGKRFVVTGLIASGNLSISANALATVVIYEASSDTTATADKVLIQFGITRLQTLPLLPLNIRAAEGKFINAKTDDDDVFLTIMGYYVPGL